jgi:hypothetical protein
MADLPDKHATARRLIRGCEDVLSKLEQSDVRQDHTQHLQSMIQASRDRTSARWFCR